ncbi:MAG TPA: endopeptidase La [Acidimicrobiales bacterium]|jgi:ATP-dependent Lon protease|nr:endopeptidase La [Acidimicrobiales bacterium]
MSSIATSALPLLPLEAGVVLPGMTITIALETPEAREAVSAASGAGDRLVLVPRLGSDPRFASIGTVATIDRRGSLPGGTPAVVVSGTERVSLGAAVSAAGNALWVNVEPVHEPAVADEDQLRESSRELTAVLEAIAEHRGLGRVREAWINIEDPGRLADLAGYWPELSLERKVELLETVDPARRVQLVLGWAREALAELELKDRIRTDVAEGMERTQREYLLRQQLAAIRKELGEAGGDADDDDYRSRLEALDIDAATRTAIQRELDKLERTSEQSPEHGWIRTWLDTVFELPWGERSIDPMDVVAARAVLDADHTGLDDVKERIVEHLAVRKLRAERLAAAGPAATDGTDTAPTETAPTETAPTTGRGDGMILALVGPPGVGKTSLGESIARATGRKFVRVALGGVRDEAEIRGHRRTYVGALPGRIVRAVKDAGTMNPVVLLDEIDKLGADWRGDPSSALLEVLDPAQNHTFRDHYLDLDLDLSDVLFLATANFAEQIPGPLFDRMEVVHLDGYTDAEKVDIARRHLLGRQLRRAGLLDGEVEVTDAALLEIVNGYTREAGVRSLERQLGRLLRKAAARIAAGESQVVVDAGDLRGWLGRPHPGNEVAERTSTPGVATGLAVTGIGGDVLFVEASAAEGESGLVITGQLGEVMQESAQIALSYVRAHAAELGLPPGALDNRRLHIHVPAGAVPKDGPSAGVTMTTAIVSLLTGRPVRSDLGMTGEITLQGKVLPIGGVKQKVLAAHRAGLTEVVLPSRNGDDLEDVPESVREEMTFHLASNIGEVLDRALEEISLAA